MQKRGVAKPLQKFKQVWGKAWWTKTIIVFLAGISLLILLNVLVANWYVASTRDKPLKLGVTFVPDYARALGLDAEETMEALTRDLGVRHFRLTSYWNKIEKEQGTYDFSELDWQFEKAEAVNAKVTLSIGMRQPRWPECHEPDWVKNLSIDERQQHLHTFLSKVIDRYKHSSSLTSYQLENEALLKSFGECPDTTRKYLQEEFDLVKKLDSKHPIIMSKSNNFPSLSLGKPRPDIVGMSVYRKVWNTNIYNGYFTYPMPSWYYAAIAGWQKIWTGKDTILHEMQMEPYPPSGTFVADASLEEQDKSMSARDFAPRVEFAKQTGMREIYLWGAEWWYYRLVELDDPGVWDEAKKTFRES